MNIENQISKIQKSAVSDPRFKQHIEDSPVTDQALDGINKLFNSILPHFPGWRQACPTDDDLSRLKLVWTKALMRNKQKTGKNLNLKAGITACEESETDWLPSVGKFIKWCDQTSDIELLALRALELFNSGQKQIDNIGQMVVGKHSFYLKNLKASENKKQFVELYLTYAEGNAINELEGALLTETVQLSDEQQKDREKAIKTARNEFFAKFGAKGETKKVIEPKKKAKGIKSGSTGRKAQTQKQADESRNKQLKAMGLK
jgi:hypothetical protein